VIIRWRNRVTDMRLLYMIPREIESTLTAIMYPDQCKIRCEFSSNNTIKANNSNCLTLFLFLTVLTLNSFENKVLTQIMHNRKLVGIIFDPFLCNTDVLLHLTHVLPWTKIFIWICIRSGWWMKRLANVFF